MIRDLTELDHLAIYPRLLEVAASTPVSRALPPAKARYLRMLVAARDRTAVVDADSAADETVVDVPLRLFPRVLDAVDLIASAGTDQLAEALRLEIAAVSDGRMMSEWAPLAALRLSL